MKTITTFLPLFPGFYETIFDPRYWIEDLEYQNDKHYTINWENFVVEAGRSLTEALSRILDKCKFPKIELEYERVWSPSYYNYHNDVIDVKITISKESFSAIMGLKNQNTNLFKDYIERKFKPRDGFIPFYSHHVESEDWNFDYDSLEEHSSEFGWILEFLLRDVYNYDSSILLDESDLVSIVENNLSEEEGGE